MRDPRIDPRKGDVLEQTPDGERRTVVARRGDLVVQYVTNHSGLLTVCSPEQWREWAKQASVIDPKSSSQ
jgi:hypothetical protein